MSLLQIENLNVVFRQRFSDKPVLRGVSLQVDRGDVCALVGESGAGKSMIAKAILGLLPASAKIRGGSIQFDGMGLLQKGSTRRKSNNLIGHRIALIPQDPMVSLNPVRRIGVQMSDIIMLHLGESRAAARQQSLSLLEEVMIKEPERVYESYAHELSGGMRQRILIAMAFSCSPDLIIADEPTTALDVTVQMQVLKMLRSLQQKKNTAILFVTHDLGVVSKISDRVVVLYDGHVLEDSPVESLFNSPQHEYTRALLAATPRYDQPTRTVTPVPESVIDGLRHEKAAIDAPHE